MVEFGSNGQVIDDAAGQVPIAVKDGIYKAEGKTFDPLWKRYGPMRFGLVFYLILTVIYSAALIVEIIGLTFFGVDIYEIEDGFGQMASPAMVYFFIFTTLTFWFCALSICRWTHRAMTNLHVIRSPEVEMSPNWSVGWYFLPVASLFKPYQGMREIWSGSAIASGQTFSNQGRPALWWGTWIGGNLFSYVSGLINRAADDIPLYLLSVWIDLAAMVIVLISIIVLLSLTKQITDAQSQIQDGGLEATFA